MSWMANCQALSCRSFRGTKLLALWRRRAGGPIDFKRATGLGYRGWAGPAAPASTCATERENLCDQARFTGYTLDGGYAEYTVADQRFCFPIPDGYSDAEAAPLLCAGFIGYRSLAKTGQGRRVGIYGFGAAAHIVVQVARFQGREIYAFTRRGDWQGQQFARSLGAVWAGDSALLPPARLDAAILFAPAGELVPLALQAVGKGGIVVCGGIHMSDIPAFAYALLWEERTLCSVANLTRGDGREFLALAPRVPVRTTGRDTSSGPGKRRPGTPPGGENPGSTCAGAVAAAQGPTWPRSMGWKPSLNAGEPGWRRKSFFSGAAKSGSATMELRS